MEVFLMINTVLLVVDVQTALVEEHPYNETTVVANIKNIISTCRVQGIEVIYVRHDGGVGDELERNTVGWSIYEDISPMDNEKVFDKQYNSAFRDTGLKEYLETKDIHNIILVGMQTEYCIDATCKVAFEYGYNVMIPEDTTTTYDTPVLSGKALSDYYTHYIWNNRYAKVLSIEQLNEYLSV